ncbi:uncharacterized protein L3040_006491 [Drepanopeziza brunnea f. sp. 'multigermtubi']|uniref:non-specific serine/threonine protein kinase n=1 Tax=Marssonina brunnea f. sp. multigermtubi (strain MB_m1) TaxID=1072389 RepID=K1X1V8_MARBU|nr:serine/threonine-protein kinase-like protein [Drepanopeziza brunnea f. sp. 'multigermtubi' MB_m1]EKD18997.1 serine/threonine-protein kinase-like protein [Drepanopeziza brunnea f. sp. 'multigermtubi' MB_m1]KAJ5038812.1 hypothetical protein L3040_006491 [Drepanopeziza brunnea f. sp. 'multigermtubi']
MEDSPLRPSQVTQPGTANSSSIALPSSPLFPDPSSPANPQDNFADDPYWVATQIVTDPRRLGQAGSGLSSEDLGDIICILHPTTQAASRAAALIHEDPNAHPGCTLVSANNVEMRVKGSKDTAKDTSYQLAAEGLVLCDLVLRLSAPLKDPLGGFQFGRSPSRCDFVLGKDQASKRISNIHFRIYLNEHGYLMLEDQSTNGTAVDGALLRGKEKENNKQHRRTLEHGSVITLAMTPPEQDYQFMVRIPPRDQASEQELWSQNLRAFILHTANLRMHKEARIAAGGLEKKGPPNLFPTAPATPDPNLPSGKVIRVWKGGPKYNRLEMIGKGAFAVVYKLTDKYDGVPYAAKELEKRRFMKNGILDQKVDNEMKIMRKIKHPHVVQFIEHVDWDEYLYIIMEFIPGGDLGSLISREGYLPEPDVQIMAKQLLSALKYLHDGGITHRDVKPDNILISTRNPLHVKLTDFGLSKMIDGEDTFLRTFCGTLLYCAPEVYSEYREYDETGKRSLRGMDKRFLPPQRYGHAVDIWSTAGVLFYALCGSPPFPVKKNTSYQELLNQIMTCHLDIRPLQLANVSENGIRFVKSMLIVRPEQRATIEQLEQRSWFLGGNSFQDSMENDEVDQIGGDDSNFETQLEQGTSQLSINPELEEFDDSQLMIDDDLSHLLDDSQEMMDGDDMSLPLELQPREIPSSFANSDSNSSAETQTYRMVHGGGNSEDTVGRLFGEVNASAIGSSGALPLDHLHLPFQTTANNHGTAPDDSQQSRYLQESPGDNHRGQSQGIPAAATVPTIMPPPPPPPPTPSTRNPITAARHPEIEDRAVRESSLMGAEAMVGNLNMHSPASATSPGAEAMVGNLNSPASATFPGTESLAPTTEDTREAFGSVRRPREEEEEDWDDESWRPADLPIKRRKSSRQIDMRIPPTVFWDPSDRSTHHYDYPSMTSMQFKSYQEYAEKKGEVFAHGQNIFEVTMQSFRNSRSPSLEPERAASEPIKDEGRRMLMKRDERKLEEPRGGRGKSESRTGEHPVAQENFIPLTAHPFDTASKAKSTTTHYAFDFPSVGNDFQAPKRILAKAVSTVDSCLAISLNITDSAFSWGRGESTTTRYANGKEDRVPKYAFKTMLFKPGYYKDKPAPLDTTHVWNQRDTDMSFYISTKATLGIWVNGAHIPGHDLQHPNAESLFWGELRNGDIITVWRNDSKVPGAKKHTRLRFECFWGKSMEVRKEPFHIIEEGAFLDELEEACLIQEGAIINENKHRRAEDMKVLQREKEEKSARQNEKAIKFESSFSGAPSTE